MRLSELRKKNGISQLELAKYMNVSRTTVSMWESKKSPTQPDSATISRLADYFGVTTDYLLGRTDTSSQPRALSGAYPITNVARIPIIGDVRAGFNLLATEKYEGYIEVMDTDPSEHFAFRIVGDSMEPRFSDGDIAIVHVQPQVENGDVIVAVYDGECGTIKRYRETSKAIILESYNELYEPMIFLKSSYDIKELRIIGKVEKVIVKL